MNRLVLISRIKQCNAGGLTLLVWEPLSGRVGAMGSAGLRELEWKEYK